MEGDLFVWSGRGWQLVIGPRHRVESEDIPEGVNTALVGVEHMTELSLEPTAASRTAYALLRRTAKALASSAHGAVLDLQTDTMATPIGVRRFVRSAAGEVLDALELSWFSTYEAMRSRNWLDEFLRLLEREFVEGDSVVVDATGDQIVFRKAVAAEVMN